ncbi:hydrogenase expression/formation protein HypE [Candidatus Altiarchaeota archaeon]
MSDKAIGLAHGSGGKEMMKLIKSFGFSDRGKWKNFDDDSATLDLGDGRILVFTTDSFVVDPIFFPGGDIGHLAVCGTINDLVVMGADPLGLSLSFVLEEGFSRKDLERIVDSVDKVAKDTGIPIVTGDTKVMEKGKVDKIIVNISGVGLADKKDLLTKKVEVGDTVVLSGGLGEHAVALLSKRFDYETSIVTDSKPLIEELRAVKTMIKVAKDPTRGGIAASLNELCERFGVGIIIDEESVPAKKEVRKVTEMLGINLYELACEGRFICICSQRGAHKVVKKLREFNPDATVIGEVIDDDKVLVQTMLGKRILPTPTGRIVPRIC